MKLPATRCGESPIVKEKIILYSLANPVASSGECARCSIHFQEFLREEVDKNGIYRINKAVYNPLRCLVNLESIVFLAEAGCFVSRENHPVIVIPAIDIRDGKCVRLLQGDFDRTTVYSDDPVDMAKKWQEKGAARIHLVDLDGSRTGSPQNRAVIERIAREIDVPLQVGGGIRDIETVRDYIEMGVGYCIVGTVALKDRDFVIEACQQFNDSIILGIDARDGKVAVEGWTERTILTPLEIAQSYEGCGLAAIVYTDIARDGMETGVNIEATKELAESVNIPIIASGGVSSIDDIEKLINVEKSGIIGVITGKALYEGTLTLEEAVTMTRMTGR